MTMTHTRFRSAGSALVLLFLTACTWTPVPRTLASGGAYRAWAVDAVERMREAFNRGECASIYDEASEPFRRLEARQDWLTDCEQIRGTLGVWRSLRTRSASARQGFEAHVDGTAVSAGGECRLQTTWTLENGHVRLFSLCLQSGNRLMVPAPVSPRPLPLTDPPLDIEVTPNHFGV